jgi:Streptomycin adenylyltransferase
MPSASTTPLAHIARFADMCKSDERIVAAFVTGSHAAGTSDAHSDIDLGLIATATAVVDGNDIGSAVIHQLGETIFLEHFDAPDTLFFILADGTVGELVVANEHSFTTAAKGPFQVLVDKTGVLADVALIGREPAADQQVEHVRRLVTWFWHDFAHLLTALERGQLGWAYGQTEALRRMCVSLARLRHDASDIEAATEPYFKVDLVLSPTQLAVLQRTSCAMEASSIHSAARGLLMLYRELAPTVAKTFGIPYPVDLERLMVTRFEAADPSA